GARRARLDEERHAEMMSTLARAAGARPLPADVAPIGIRPLDEVAIENSVEGCMREALGALTAAAQARRATDPPLSTVLTRIARDEARHANLAWAVDEWATRRLPTAARRRVRTARITEARSLLHARG